MICNHCKTQMKRVLSFDKDKIYKFYRCPICYFESKKMLCFFNKKQDRKSINKKHTSKKY